MNEQRVARVRAEMQAHGLTQMIISDSKSIWYLTGASVEPYERLMALYRDVLYGRVWGGDLLDSRTLDLHIQRLRKKLGWADKIETVYRVGYRLKSDQK